MCIKHNNGECKISQTIGNQSILYAEEYVLAMIPEIIYTLTLQNTSEEYSLQTIFLPSSLFIDRMPVHPIPTNRLQNYIPSKVFIYKVNSHNKADPIH